MSGDEVSRRRSVRLPLPSTFHSEESSVDIENDSGSETPATPGTHVNPLSPLGGELFFLAVSSQASEGGELAITRARKKHYSKKRADNLKRRPLFGITTDPSPSTSSQSIKITRPPSDLFSNIYFPPPSSRLK